MNGVKRAVIAQAFLIRYGLPVTLPLFNVLGQFAAIQWSLIGIGVGSFVHIVSFALFVNYEIQNFIPYHWRFLANAVFSVLMAIYYAFGEVWFG